MYVLKQSQGNEMVGGNFGVQVDGEKLNFLSSPGQSLKNVEANQALNSRIKLKYVI